MSVMLFKCIAGAVFVGWLLAVLIPLAVAIVWGRKGD